MTDEELIERLLDDAKFNNEIRDIAAIRIKQLQLELDNERQYQVSMEYLWALDRELLSNLKEHSENVEHERDEALNQLDSAKHNISVLEKRVLQVTKQRDASLILNKFYKEDRKQRDRLLEVGEAKLAKAVEALQWVDKNPWAHPDERWTVVRAALAELGENT